MCHYEGLYNFFYNAFLDNPVYKHHKHLLIKVQDVLK